MKNNNVFQAALLGLAMILSAGCVKESFMNDKYRPAGSVISFSTMTGYENGTGVRTEYSGQLYGDSPKYERINWVVNDPITISYVHGSEVTQSGFAVTEVDASTDKKSTATVDVAEGADPLTWSSGDDDHLFYAMYPTTGFGGNSSASLTGGNHVSGTIPATQTITRVGSTTRFTPAMQYAYMVAFKRIDSGSMDRQVSLPFTPAMTAFEFKLQGRTGSVDMKVTSVTLTSVTPDQTPLTGSFAFDITGGDEHGAIWNKTTSGTNPTVITDAGYSVTASFPEGGISLPVYGSEDYLDFTLFALPVEQKSLEITLSFLDGSTKKLALKNAGTSEYHAFAAAKKHVITNSSVPDLWEYTITATNPAELSYLGSAEAGASTDGTVTSYRQLGGTGTKYPVSWTVEGFYYDAACTIPVPDAENWITSFNGGSGVGSATGESVTINYAEAIRSISETIVPESQALNALVAVDNAGGELGSSSNYLNLADPAGSLATGTETSYIAESANSYIVNKVGWYKIPLVMGNGIKGGVTNPVGEQWKGYDDEDGLYKEDWRVWFRDYQDQYIKDNGDPWLVSTGGTPTSAEIVWEDVEGLVETDAEYNLPAGSITSDGRWLKIHIPAERAGAGIINGQNEPRQGNAVISVRDGNGTVMWAYHIWVTDYVPKNYPGYSPTNDDIVTYGPIILAGKENEKGSGMPGPSQTVVNRSFNYRFMGRNLGTVEYGRTLTTTYSPHDVVYVKLSQENSLLTAVVALNQGNHSESEYWEIGAPTYTHAKIVPNMPATNVAEQVLPCYGRSSSNQALDGVLSLGQYIQNIDKQVYHNPTGNILQGISATKFEHFFHHHSDNDTRIAEYDNIPSALMSQMIPSNLWQAFSRHSLKADPNLSQIADSSIRTPISTGRSFMYGPDYGDLHANDKTVYDPCPVGYWVGSATTLYVFFNWGFISNATDTAAMAEYGWGAYTGTHKCWACYSITYITPSDPRPIVSVDSKYYKMYNAANGRLISVPRIGALYYQTGGTRFSNNRDGCPLILSGSTLIYKNSSSYGDYITHPLFLINEDMSYRTDNVTWAASRAAGSIRPIADVNYIAPKVPGGLNFFSEIASYYNDFVEDPNEPSPTDL